MAVQFHPYKTRHGWIVAASVIHTDDSPTFSSERAAEALAEALNDLHMIVPALVGGTTDGVHRT